MMAKAIEQTPVLEGKDAERFLQLLLNVDQEVNLTKHEEKVKEMLKDLPSHLKL